jgi:hypothetical protein
MSEIIMSSVSGLLYGFIKRNDIFERILLIVVLTGFIANILLLISQIAIYLLNERSSLNNSTISSAPAQEISSVNLEIIDTSSVIQTNSDSEVSIFRTYIDLETRREFETSRSRISDK